MANRANILERNIKELLQETPELGDVLSSFNIGCVSCTDGTCQLKDIVKYHYLPEEQLQELMRQIAMVVVPGAAREIALQEAATVQQGPQEFNYSPPMLELVQEHALIKRLLAVLPNLVIRIDLEQQADRQVMRESVDFIRAYADRFHHAKEEDILFPLFDENQPIIRVMRTDHTTGRSHVAAMYEALDMRNQTLLFTHVSAYRKLLSEHIKKEDEILYPWMDRQLSIQQVADLLGSFREANGRFDAKITERFTQLLERLER